MWSGEAVAGLAHAAREGARQKFLGARFESDGSLELGSTVDEANRVRRGQLEVFLLADAPEAGGC